jgi:arabinogalactan endo-1,4-beta-galactosidase
VNDKPDNEPAQLGRRSVLLGAAAGAVLLGTSALPRALAAPAASAAAATTFVKAVDVSLAPQMEAHGYSWKNAVGQTQDLLTILKGYGIGAVRLRTLVNPSNDAANGHCGITEVAAFAKRVKAAEMSIMLDYMFGDTWNSVGVQNPPGAWKNMSYSQMLTAMNNYVSQTMNVMKTNGMLPTWVQIGNEINTGICHPVGSVGNGAQLAGLLNAAYNQVKQVSPSTTVCIHLAQPQKYPSMQTFFNAYSGHGGKWDMSVFSSYGSASLADGIVANTKKISDAYHKPFMQSEFGGPVSKASATEASLVAYIKALKNNGGQGIFYWEPECMSPFTGYGNGAWNSASRRCQRRGLFRRIRRPCLCAGEQPPWHRCLALSSARDSSPSNGPAPQRPRRTTAHIAARATATRNSATRGRGKTSPARLRG